MDGKRFASVMTALLLATMSWGGCLAGGSPESAGSRPSPAGMRPSILVQEPDAASIRLATPPTAALRPPDSSDIAVPPAVSLDRRVPAAQPHDREGLSLVGVLGVVGELRHAFGRDRGEIGGTDLARLARTLRDSVLRKRISILSESGRLSENDPYLVGLSFTH